MYGLGMAKGMVVTLKNLVLPSRKFTLHQYPDRKISPLGLAKRNDTTVVKLALKTPLLFAKCLMGLVSVEDRYPQHPRFRGEEFTWYEERCTGCASCAKYCPLGIIKIVTERNGEAKQEGQKYGVEVFDIDIGRCMFCGLCMESCPFNSFFMTNEYDGMSGFTREDLWFEADRTRVLPVQHAEAVDIELAKRADQARKKAEKAAAKAAKSEA